MSPATMRHRDFVGRGRKTILGFHGNDGAGFAIFIAAQVTYDPGRLSHSGASKTSGEEVMDGDF
jgi:hypothetical protein